MPKKKTYVPGSGDRNADIVFVGEAPGKDEEGTRKPFVGYSGKLFRSTASSVGILLSRTYITNVCHYRPPRNNIKKYVKIKEKPGIDDYAEVKVNGYVAEGMAELYRDLAEIKPNVIVPMGNIALWALTGKMRVTKRRGSIMEVNWDNARTRSLAAHGLLDESVAEALATIQGTKVIPTLHPAHVMRKMEMLDVLGTDLTRVFKESLSPEIDLPERTFYLNPEEPLLSELVEKLLAAEKMSYDIEVVGGDTLYCVGFGCDPSWALTLTVDSHRNVEVVDELLRSDVPKIAQNGMFDQTFLLMFSNFEVNNFAEDTMVAQACIYPEFPKGLDFLASIYTREPYYKDEGKDWSPKDAEDVHRFLTYNAKDVAVTQEVHEAQASDELQDPDYLKLYRRVMSQIPVYVKQAVSGIRVDVREMERLKLSYTQKAMRLQEEVDDSVLSRCVKLLESAKTKKREQKIKAFMEGVISGRGTLKGGLNVNSYKDLQTWFYEILGYKPEKNRKTGRWTTSETALNAVYARTGDEDLRKVIKIRQHRKRISSYLNIKTDATGKTYFSINPVKTKTGRSAYGKTINGYGLNMQTNPHELRKIWLPEDGYLFSYIDLGQAEARVVAYAGGVEKMIYAFENGIDLHSQTASLILGLDMSEIEEYPHRYLGKKCNHAFNYEMGPYKFHDEINNDAPETGVSVTRSLAKKLRARHFKAYPELELYWEWIREEIRGQRGERGVIINAMGRKRKFRGRFDDNLFREAFSHYAQSTVADVTRTGMVEVDRFFEQNLTSNYPHTRVVLEVHDALLVQIPKGSQDEVIPEVQSLMEFPINVRGNEIVIPTDAAVGENFGSFDEDDNPKGLKKYARADGQ